MKISLCQINLKTGNLKYNIEKIKKLYKDKYYSMFDKFFEKFGKKTVPIPTGFVEKDGEN